MIPLTRFVQVLLAVAGLLAATSAAAGCPLLLDHVFPKLQDGKPQSLCQYEGKVILVVNTASFCGFTGQYDGLESVYDKYKARGLVVIGFPSNDFGDQEPGSNKEIAERVFVSENTVKTHSSRVFEKLGARRRTQAVHLAKEFRLIP